MSKRNYGKSGRGGRRAANQQAGGRFRTAAGERGARLVGLSKNALFGQGIPDETHVTLKWGIHSTTATSTSFAISALAANDVRDPGIATAATSAVSFAGYIANYAQFYVLASRIRIRATHAATASGVGTVAVGSTVGVFASAGATTANDRSSAEAQAGCRQVTFDVGGQKTIEEHAANPQVAGVSKAQYIADQTYWGGASASPTDLMYWNVWSQSSAAQTSLSIDLDIQIEYDVVFFRRRYSDLAFEKKLLVLVLEREARDAVVRATAEQKLLSGDDFTSRLAAHPGADEDSGLSGNARLAIQPGRDEKDVLPVQSSESKGEHAAAPPSLTPSGKQVDRFRPGAEPWVLTRAVTLGRSAKAGVPPH